MPDEKRLFVAIDIPDTLKPDLKALQSGLEGVRWVTREQMHLTLRFIGNVDAMKFETLKKRLAEVRFPAFEMRLMGTGKFPAKGAPRVLWVGVAAPDALQQLAQAVESAVVSCGLPRADKPFSPHITLGRVKNAPPRHITEAYFANHVNFASEPFTVKQFVLYSSELHPSGAVYTREAVFTG